MQQYYYPAAEKILSDIENIIRKDPLLNAFEIIPVMKNENKSPIHHHEHCLGLEGWCVPHVYCHAYKHVLAIRQNRSLREDAGRVNRLLMGALIINPQISTFWNMRKEMMCRGKLDPQFELHLTEIILSKKPKSDDVFNHRKWIIRSMLKDFQSEMNLLDKELRVCEAAAERYANNYHAWSHRAWCLAQVGGGKVLAQEWAWSEAWVWKHVGDSSGLHHRGRVVAGVLASDATVPLCADPTLCQTDVPRPVRLLSHELTLCSDLIDTFPGHEALWNHRRYVFHLIKSYFSQGVSLTNHDKIDTSNTFLLDLTIYEQKFLNKTLSKMNDARNKDYVEKHIKWIKDVVKIPINI